MSFYASYPPISSGGGGSGTVTSVALADGSTSPIYTISGSPVTTSGTLTFTLGTKAANLVFAGPTTGAAAQPAFRSLVAADLPAGTGTVTSVAMSVPSLLSVSGSPITGSGTFAVTYSGTPLPILNGGTGQTTASAAFNALSPMTTAGDLIYGGASGAGTRLAVGSSGNVLTVSGGNPVWAAPATSGTVTSVAMSVPSLLSVSGSPITSSGTLAVTYSGTALPVANGGTGLTSGTSGGILGYTASGTLASSSALTANQLIIGGGAGATPSTLAAGTNTNVLTMVAGVPAWAAPATSGTVTSVAMSVPAFLSVAGSPITSSGTLAVSYSGTALPIANGGTNSTTSLNSNRFMVSSAGAIVEASAVTASRVVVSDSNGLPSAAATSTTQVEYLSAATGTTGTTSTNLVF